MPSLNISITDEQAKKVQNNVSSGKYTMSSFFQHILNYYFEGSNAVIKRDFVIFMVYPLIFDVLLWVCFIQSHVTFIFYSGLLSLGLTIASVYYVMDRYKDDLRGKY